MIICKTKEDYELLHSMRAHGWDRGLKNRRLGEVVDLKIPAKLAYGARGSDEGIPYGPLVFDLELLGYK